MGQPIPGRSPSEYGPPFAPTAAPRADVLGAVLLTALPEVLRYVVGPLQAMTNGRLDAGILRPLLIALAMIVTMLWRPHGLWPSPDRAQ